MPDAYLGSLIVVLACLSLSAFFSSSESAFLTLKNSARLTHLATTGATGAVRVAGMLEEPGRLLSTILLGNNLANVAFASVVTAVTLSFLEEGIGVAVATAIATAVLLIVGETVPKTIAVRHAERVAFFSARPLKWMEALFFPFIVALQWTTRIPGLGEGEDDEQMSITEEELRTLIDVGEDEGAFEPAEAEMLESVFRFGDRQVREVITPRTEIVFVERGATLGQFLGTYARHTHTRFPVFKESPDNIVGIISAKDILKSMSSREIKNDGDPVTDLIRDVHYVPETKRIAELFDELRQTGNQMAIAIDEYGGIAGLVTLKRLLEEVVGRVGEEGASPEEEYEALGEDTYQVDGGMSIDETKEELGIELPEGEFETIAGFVLNVLGHIPAEGELFEQNNLRVEVTRMDGLKVETVKLTKLPK